MNKKRVDGNGTEQLPVNSLVSALCCIGALELQAYKANRASKHYLKGTRSITV